MAKKDLPFEVVLVLVGFDDLKTRVLPGEVDIVMRMLKDACESPDQDPQIKALCEQLGFRAVTTKSNKALPE